LRSPGLRSSTPFPDTTLFRSPRASWNRAGLAMGIGLLVGVLMAAAALFVPFPGAVPALLGLGMLLGLVLAVGAAVLVIASTRPRDRKSTRLNSSHVSISYAVF